GCPLARRLVGPGARRLRPRRGCRKRICATLLCLSVLRLRLRSRSCLRLWLSGLQLWLSAVLRLRRSQLFRLLPRTLLALGARHTERGESAPSPEGPWCRTELF